MTTFHLKISLLSPLHIGSGEELRAEFDFIIHSKNTYRLDVDAIMLDFADQFQPDSRGIFPTPGYILKKFNSFSNPKYYRYVIKGYPRSNKIDARVHECIKDVHDEPYLPGSSIKGALRTALAWSGWSKKNLEVNAWSRNKFQAGSQFESALFGKTPNVDLLKALHVSDCFSTTAKKRLILANAQVLTKTDIGTPIELEALAGDIVFTGSLKIDETYFSKAAEEELHFSNRKHWLDELLIRAQKHSRARIESMLKWFNTIDNGERVVKFLDQLYSVELSSNQALIQIGWGTGWDGMTFWTHLQQDEYLFEKMLKEYNMVRKGHRELGDVFPKSRRVVMQTKDGVDKPLAPFGWVLVEMEPLAKETN